MFKFIREAKVRKKNALNAIWLLNKMKPIIEKLEAAQKIIENEKAPKFVRIQAADWVILHAPIIEAQQKELARYIEGS